VCRTVNRIFGSVVAGLFLSSCGGSPSSPSSASGSTTGGSSNSSITITISSSGVSPKQLTVSPGTRVLFTNNDSRAREMTSDPHPEHTDCVEINNIGNIVPGQTKETGNLNTVKTCGYHDHGNPDDARFKGQIIIK
jgi:plastocyanin